MDYRADTDNDDESSDLSSDSSEIIDVEKTQMEEVQICMESLKLIKENPKNYDAYVSCIKVLRSVRVLDAAEELHDVREKFSKEYPLSTSIWLEWIRDESSILSFEKLCELYQLAIQDFSSVEIWDNYLSFLIESFHDGEKVSIDNLRKEFEKAVEILGTHFSQGEIIWKKYRDFEQQLNSEDSDNLEQKNRVRELYRRQLRQCLAENESVLSEFRVWIEYNYNETNKKENDLILNELESTQNLLKEKRNKLTQLEIRIASPEEVVEGYERYYAREFNEYVFEDKESMQRVYGVLERAICDQSLSIPLWLRYVEFVSFHTKQEDFSEKAHNLINRAIRNVTWSGDLYIYLIHAKEKLKKPFNEVKQVVEGVLTVALETAESYLNVLLCYCNYARRYYHSNGEKDILEDSIVFSLHSLHTLFPDWIDGWFILQRLSISIQIEVLNNEEKAKQLCEEIFNKRSDKMDSWIACINYFHQIKEWNYCRQLYKRSIFAIQDFTLQMCEAWLTWERDYGNLLSWEKAKVECLQMQRQLYVKQLIQEKKKVKTQENTMKRKFEPEKKVQQNKKTKSKVKLDKTNKGNSIKSKYGKMEENLSVKEVDKNISFEKKSAEKEDELFTESEDKQPTENTISSTKVSSRRVSHTLFICNLSKSTTLETLQSLFKKVEGFLEVRLASKERGNRVKSRAFAYAEFQNPSAMEEGLKLNGISLDGNIISVEISNPPITASKSSKKETWKLDPFTLYVGNISLLTTSESLKAAFEKFGHVQDAIVMTRHGKSKGYGLVSYQDKNIVSELLSIPTTPIEVDDVIVEVRGSRFPITREQKQKEKKISTHQKKSISINMKLTDLVPTNIKENQQKTMQSNEDFRKMINKKN